MVVLRLLMEALCPRNLRVEFLGFVSFKWLMFGLRNWLSKVLDMWSSSIGVTARRLVVLRPDLVRLWEIGLGITLRGSSA